MLNKVALEQGSEAWLEWRDTGTGSSDVSVITKRSKYKSQWRLWAEKLGFIKSKNLDANPHVRRGKKLEKQVISFLEDRFGTLSNYCAEDTEKPWRIVSFDAVTSESIPIEIKCPGTSETEENDRYTDLKEKGRSSKLFWEYEEQLQYQIGMLDAPYGYFAFYFEHNNELLLYKVARNDIMISQIMKAVDSFNQNHLQTGIPPEKDPNLDFYEPSEQELIALDCYTMEFLEAVAEEREINKKLKAIKKRKNEAAIKLFNVASDFRELDLHGVKITSVKPRSTFKIKQFLDDKGIDITDEEMERYTQKGKVSFRISANKDKTAQVKNRALKHQAQMALEILSSMDDEEREYLSASSSEMEDSVVYYY